MTGKPRVQSTSRVVGHGLRHEGWPYDENGVRRAHRNYSGHGRCECGEMSKWEATIAARRRWHREHKDEVRRGE